MKKLAFALMCAMSLLLVVSCSKKEETTTPKDPTVEFVNAGSNYVYENTTKNVGDSIGIKILATATDEKDLITELKVTGTWTQEDQILFSKDTVVKVNKEKTSVFLGEPEPALLAGVYKVVATVTTEAGRTATKGIEITILPQDPTSGEADFEWYRQGGNPGLGLEMFGLKWTSNYKDVCAKIVVYNSDFDEMRRLDGVDYNAIEDVVAAYNEGVVIDEFHEISCEKPSATYDYVIGTHSRKFAGVERDMYFIMHVTNSTVTTDVLGTTVTITGRYKWVEIK